MGQSDKANDEACPEEPVQLREPNRYQPKDKEPVRKAGLDVDNAELSKKDMKTVDAAKDNISKHMANLIVVGLGATGV